MFTSGDYEKKSLASMSYDQYSAWWDFSSSDERGAQTTEDVQVLLVLSTDFWSV